jgi:predicted tellurium resistance membrane protein TerC
MEIFNSEHLIALLTLTALEIVLGIDNVVFIAILVGKLPIEVRAKIRQAGLFAAMFMRIGLLLAISWIMNLTTPLFALFQKGFSGRDLILLLGGLFLVGKATFEIHDKIEGAHVSKQTTTPPPKSMLAVFVQIIMIDIVFSLDSVITAVGMTQEITVMIVAVVLAVIVMMFFAAAISHTIEKHPSLKILALAFLLLIGVMLLVEGMGEHFNKGYIYFAMAFSLAVELINIRIFSSRKSV